MSPFLDPCDSNSNDFRQCVVAIVLALVAFAFVVAASVATPDDQSVVGSGEIDSGAILERLEPADGN